MTASRPNARRGLHERLLRRWAVWRRARRLELVYSERYRSGVLQATHDPERGARVLLFLESERLLRRRRLHRAEPVSLRAVRRIHSDEYLESLQDPAVLARIMGVDEPPADLNEALEIHRVMVGGTVQATRLARSRGTTAVNLGGGFHHALAGRGQGFCVFNDVAVAIADQRERGARAPVLVIDLDLHDGDGTRDIFARDPSVHTFSVHNRDLAAAPAESSTSVALGSGVEDREYLDAVRLHLPSLIDGVKPGLVFYVAGSDPAGDDALGNWNISAEGMAERDRLVFEAARGGGRKIPLVVVLGGGYGHGAWRYTARWLGRLLSGRQDLEPPSTEAITMVSYRRLLGRLNPVDLTREPSEQPALTEADLLGALRGAPPPARFLDYYSKHGVELALERYGFLDRLRARGFRPRLEIDLGDATGQTLRILTGDERPQPLVELRVRRDRKTAGEMELLFIEWLLLQDPRASFAASRSALPGQKHPGLGLLRETVGLLVLACERLGLDGVAFCPSHYHLAVQSRRYLHFLEPEDEARFRALLDALRDLPLAEATRAVDQGRIVDGHSGTAVEWKPAPMVIPVSERMKRRVRGEDYETAVARLAGHYAFRID